MKSKKGITMAMALCLAMTFLGCGKSPDEAVMATEVMTTEETTVEETSAEETTAEETTEVETAAAEESTEETTVETTKAETKAETKAGPKAETKAAPKAEAPKAPAPTQAAPAPTQAPAHEHQWKEHKATRQEWVSNIVSIPDYEVQKVETGRQVVCACGEINPSQDHTDNHILNGEDSGYEYVYTYEDQKVQVGSHDEDQGYYKDVEYVDYQYCDCGATK